MASYDFLSSLKKKTKINFIKFYINRKLVTALWNRILCIKILRARTSGCFISIYIFIVKRLFVILLIYPHFLFPTFPTQDNPLEESHSMKKFY